MRLNDCTICAQNYGVSAPSNTWMQRSRLRPGAAATSVCIVPMLQYRLQRRQDRFEVPAIAPPAVDALAVDRLGDLRITRRCNISLLLRVLVEPEHRRRVGDADEIADALRRPREIGQQIFV